MWYAIIATDVADSLSQRQAARPRHLARLRELDAAGRLHVAGPFPAIDSQDPGTAGFTGSLIVADFPSLEDAEAWAAADPYQDAGVYAHVSVRPYRQVFPE